VGGSAHSVTREDRKGLLAVPSALITGAGSGIGRATATTLAAAGWRVGLVGRSRETIAQTARAIVATGGSALALPGDVRDFAAMAAISAEFAGEGGRIDALIANAAIADNAPFTSGDPTIWEDVIRTNVLGVMYTVRAALPYLVLEQPGQIVVVSSLAGRRTFIGQPAYVASKFATVALADIMRKELAPSGVRVMVLEPGLVNTPLAASGGSVHDPSLQPLDPEDCARIIEFALGQPANCAINEIAVRPTHQLL
jgi:NADP-dependent 3-hydroxy acid dehydrogenase YdfG